MNISATAGISAIVVTFSADDTGDGGTDNGGTNPPAGTTLPASLSGSDYYVIALGSEEYALLEENDKVKLNLQPYNVGDNPDKPGIALNSGPTITAPVTSLLIQRPHRKAPTSTASPLHGCALP